MDRPQFKIPETISMISHVLEQNGFESWLVGGCVRNLIMGLEPRDWDFATNAKPDQIIALFPKTFVNNPFGTVTVVNEEESNPLLRNVEITTFRTETKYTDRRHPDSVTFGSTIEEDLQRRDYTINALSYSIGKGQITDPYKGQEDIGNKNIRAVGDPDKRLAEDPLRILRGIRLTTQLGFSIEQKTYESIQKMAPLLEHISRERIRDEFVKIINSPNPMIGLFLSEKLAVLKHLAPELEQMLHVKQNKSHKYDVWEHSLRSLQYAADQNYPFHVRLAALLHDIGKPKTRSFDESKHDYTFYGHETLGARIVYSLLNNLKFDKRIVSTVTKLVRYHMFFSDPEKITLSAVRRIIQKVGPELIWDLMNLRICDRIGMGRPKADPYRLRKYKSMVEEAMRAPLSVTSLAIRGDDVLRETGIKSGPEIGYILHALLEEVLDQPDLNNRGYLLERAKALATLPKKELEKMGSSGKTKKEQEEAEEIGKIRQKYWVK